MDSSSSSSSLEQATGLLCRIRTKVEDLTTSINTTCQKGERKSPETAAKCSHPQKRARRIRLDRDQQNIISEIQNDLRTLTKMLVLQNPREKGPIKPLIKKSATRTIPDDASSDGSIYGIPCSRGFSCQKNEVHQDVLIDSHSKLLKDLYLEDKELIDQLNEREVLSPSDVENIMSQKTSKDRNRQLLLKLSGYSRKKFNAFHELLKVNHSYLYDVLDNALQRRVTERRDSLSRGCVKCKVAKNVLAEDVMDNLYCNRIISNTDLQMILDGNKTTSWDIIFRRVEQAGSNGTQILKESLETKYKSIAQHLTSHFQCICPVRRVCSSVRYSSPERDRCTYQSSGVYQSDKSSAKQSHEGVEDSCETTSVHSDGSELSEDRMYTNIKLNKNTEKKYLHHENSRYNRFDDAPRSVGDDHQAQREGEENDEYENVERVQSHEWLTQPQNDCMLDESYLKKFPSYKFDESNLQNGRNSLLDYEDGGINEQEHIYVNEKAEDITYKEQILTSDEGAHEFVIAIESQSRDSINNDSHSDEEIDPPQACLGVSTNAKEIEKIDFESSTSMLSNTDQGKNIDYHLTNVFIQQVSGENETPMNENANKYQPWPYSCRNYSPNALENPMYNFHEINPQDAPNVQGSLKRNVFSRIAIRKKRS